MSENVYDSEDLVRAKMMMMNTAMETLTDIVKGAMEKLADDMDMSVEAVSYRWGAEKTLREMLGHFNHMSFPKIDILMAGIFFLKLPTNELHGQMRCSACKHWLDYDNETMDEEVDAVAAWHILYRHIEFADDENMIFAAL